MFHMFSREEVSREKNEKWWKYVWSVAWTNVIAFYPVIGCAASATFPARARINRRFTRVSCSPRLHWVPLWLLQTGHAKSWERMRRWRIVRTRWRKKKEECAEDEEEVEGRESRGDIWACPWISIYICVYTWVRQNVWKGERKLEEERESERENEENEKKKMRRRRKEKRSKRVTSARESEKA